MKCEECLPELGAYADGELDGDAARRVAAHLSACAACGAAHETFERAHAAYSFYRRDIVIEEFTPQLWAAVQAATAPERHAPAASHLPPPARRLADFMRALLPRPALAGALALVIFAVLVGLLRFNSVRHSVSPAESAARTGHADAPLPPSAAGAQPTSPAPAPANGSGHDGRDGAVASVQDKARRRAGTPAAAGGRRVGAGGASGGVAHVAKALTPTSPAPPAGVAALTPVAEAMLFAGTRPGAPWAEPRRHFERSQLLLRSFRNSEFAPGAGLADFAYEKRQSRQLLSRNVVLRRAAAARGDLLEEALLGDLEAILRDIAELPARPLRGRLSSIKQQIERSEIVADLQIYAAQTSTSATGY